MIEVNNTENIYSSYEYNPLVEKIVNILVAKTQNYSKDFFRLQTNFYLTLIPSSLNMKINSVITGTIPINFYGINTAYSGSGKGFSTTFLEQEILFKFRQEFLSKVYPDIVKVNLERESLKRVSSDTTQEEELEKLEKEFKSYGSYKFNFDSATTPALKQFRHKIILGGIGSLNFIMDELASNLKSNLEPLYTFLELYDKGLVKDKLLKNTGEQQRYKDLYGSTPANMLLFGTPTKLFDGGDVEDTFFDLLDIGYARRCFFANSNKDIRLAEFSPEELYNLITSSVQEDFIKETAEKLSKFANINLVGLEIKIPKEVEIKLLKYRTDCEKLSKQLPEHLEILKNELSHRYFKVLKLSAVYALLDAQVNIQEKHLN